MASPSALRYLARVLTPTVLPDSRFAKHMWLADLALVAVVFSYTLPMAFVLSPEPRAFPVSGLLVSVGLCAPYLLRRRHPLWVFLAICAVCLTQSVLDEGILGANVMVLFALYNVATRFGLAISLPAATVAVGCLLVAFAPPLAEYETKFGIGSNLVLVTVAAWLLGAVLRVRRAYIGSLTERARQLEQEKESQARIIAAEERARIAREIHDVVSHSLSVVVLMTDGAIAKVHEDPERAERALVTARDTGREAMAEMRRMVGVLRTSDASPPGPQPGIGQLDALIEASETAGLPVTLTVSGTPVRLPDGLDLCVFRIVQEGLTNARRHGGPGLTEAEVRIAYEEDGLLVEVTDNGEGPGFRNDHESGHGLVGMRERVALYGGEVRTRGRPGGGFVLTARLPSGETK